MGSVLLTPNRTHTKYTKTMREALEMRWPGVSSRRGPYPKAGRAMHPPTPRATSFPLPGAFPSYKGAKGTRADDTGITFPGAGSPHPGLDAHPSPWQHPQSWWLLTKLRRQKCPSAVCALLGSVLSSLNYRDAVYKSPSNFLVSLYNTQKLQGQYF